MSDRKVEIRERLNNATPGPWSNAIGSGGCVMTAVRYENPDTGDMTPIADCCPDWFLEKRYKDMRPDHRDDMRLITNAPTDIAYLLDEVDRLQSRPDRNSVLDEAAAAFEGCVKLPTHSFQWDSGADFVLEKGKEKILALKTAPSAPDAVEPVSISEIRSHAAFAFYVAMTEGRAIEADEDVLDYEHDDQAIVAAMQKDWLQKDWMPASPAPSAATVDAAESVPGVDERNAAIDECLAVMEQAHIAPPIVDDFVDWAIKKIAALKDKTPAQTKAKDFAQPPIQEQKSGDTAMLGPWINIDARWPDDSIPVFVEFEDNCIRVLAHRTDPRALLHSHWVYVDHVFYYEDGKLQAELSGSIFDEGDAGAAIRWTHLPAPQETDEVSK